MTNTTVTQSSQYAKLYPIYQIDFTTASTGKTVAATKRRIRWRFGFTNAEALASGRSGTDCRGEEHECVLIWSITSGKRHLYMDGKEVHHSVNKSSSIDMSFNWRNNCMLKVIAQAAPPLTPRPGYRQYELEINGQSFFDTPKMFEIGLAYPQPGQGPQRYDVQKPLYNNVYYSPSSANTTPTAAMSTVSSPSHSTSSMNGALPMQCNGFARAPAPSPAIDIMNAEDHTNPNQAADLMNNVRSNQSYHAPPYDPFNPPAAGAPPTMSSLSNQVMTIYSSSQNNNSAPNTNATQTEIRSHVHENTHESPQATRYYIEQHHNSVVSPLTECTNYGERAKYNNGAPSYGQLQIDTHLEYDEEEKKVDEMAENLKRLVNLDNINEPVEGDMRLTMDDAFAHGKKKPVSKKATVDRASYIGPSQTLREMSTNKVKSSAKEVMKAPSNYMDPNHAAGGHLVVYGNRAPPLQQMVGFGVGAHMQNGGYYSQ